nr:cytochrome c oxidase subunit III [Rhabdopleura sp. NHMO H2136]
MSFWFGGSSLNQQFFVPSSTPWPYLASLSAGMGGLGFISWMHLFGLGLFFYGLVLLFFVAFIWWRDIIREATCMGFHTSSVVASFKMGMYLFLVSEAFFFFSLIWAFFHSSLAPSPNMGCQWPPVSMVPINPFGFPALGTALLVVSGLGVQVCQVALINGNRLSSIMGLGLGLVLGICFEILQYHEYCDAFYSFSDSSYGSCFYMITGCHGLHVLAGLGALSVSFFRLLFFHFSKEHHLGFRFSAWYWHFVDVVWIVVYISFYHWGNLGYCF